MSHSDHAVNLAVEPSKNGTAKINRAALEVARQAEHDPIAQPAEVAEAAAMNDRFIAKYVTPRFNIGDALKPQPPIDWVINGLAESGGVFGVFGKPGSKKTYAMMDMGLCVAMGSPWLGRATKQCHVL